MSILANRLTLCVLVVALMAGDSRTNKVLEALVSCDEKWIHLQLVFEQDFPGLIYTEKSFPNCVYVNGSNEQPKQAFHIHIPLHRCLTVQQPNGDYENAVIVQENAHYLEATDRKYLLTCISGLSANRDDSFTVTFGGVTIKGSLPSTEVVKGSSEGHSIEYSVEILSGWGPNGQPVSAPLTVGDSIAYVVTITNLSQSFQVRIGRCWAQDDLSNIQLSDDRGCTLQPTDDVWGRFRSADRGSNVRVFYNDIKAWAFPTSNEVNIYCNLHTCPSSDQCNQC